MKLVKQLPVNVVLTPTVISMYKGECEIHDLKRNFEAGFFNLNIYQDLKHLFSNQFKIELNIQIMIDFKNLNQIWFLTKNLVYMS